MKTISTIPQARTAKTGVYKVVGPGAEGLTFRKVNDTQGVGAFNRRYRIHGERRTMSVGKLTEFSSIADVIKRSQKLMAGRDEGVDPIEARREKKAQAKARQRAKKPMDFAGATEIYLKVNAPAWKHQYARQNWVNPVVKWASPVIGELPLNDVETRHIVEIMSTVNEHGVHETARRTRAKIEAIFGAAIALGYRDIKLGNPAAASLITTVVKSLKRKPGGDKHCRRLEKIADAPGAVRALCEARESATGHTAIALDAWLLMIATCTRPSETLHAKWSEIDLERRLWVIPSTRMKGGRAHAVPLSPLALEVLERRRKASTGGDGYIFVGKSGSVIGYSGFGRAPADLGLDCASPHSWRSIFKDWATNIGKTSRDISEEALAHALGRVEGSYRQELDPERRRSAMEAYAKWLTGDAGADVIAFPARA